MTDRTEDTREPAKGCGGCHSNDKAADTGARRFDWLLWGSGALVALGLALHLSGLADSLPGPVATFSHAAWELMRMMWWGILLGIVFVGLLDRVPRDVVMAALSGGGRISGILRATAAGVLFDLCSHGILMVGMKLYERGATAGQTVAFLLASPWNSLSLTVILIALIGFGWTAAFIALSTVIAVLTGLAFEALVEAGKLPPNPAWEEDNSDRPSLGTAITAWRRNLDLSPRQIPALLRDGVKDSRMVLRWLLFGVVLAGGLRAVLSPELFSDYFGPSLLGLSLTILAATVIEVCSEGSAPLAADLINRGGAPGNSFAFLMAGVATDYTEIMSIKDTTRSWRIALALPLISVPQVILVALLLNLAGGAS